VQSPLRPRMHPAIEPAPAAERRRLGYGGFAVVLLALAVVLSSLASKVLDGERVQVDSHGTWIVLESGNAGGVVGTLLMVLATGCAALGLVTVRRTRPRSSTFAVLVAALIVWWALMVTVFQPSGLQAIQVVTAMCGAVLALGVLAAPPTLRAVQWMDLLRDLTASALLLFALLVPRMGQLPCRPDKCGIFGNLLIGFTTQENTAAAMIVVLVPLIAIQPSMRRRVFSVSVAALLVLATGSRTGLAVLAVSILYVWYSRRSQRAGATKPHVLWRSLPLGGFLVSTGLFYFASPEALTGRGLLYAAMRDQLHGVALLIGSGPQTMARAAFFLGGWTVSGEHGQAPHLLVMTGLVGWSMFAVALGALLVRQRGWSPRSRLALGLAIAAALQGMTEAAWTLEVRTQGFVAALLAIGLMCTDRSDESPGTGPSGVAPGDPVAPGRAVRPWR
jgi:hypothetical protein